MDDSDTRVISAKAGIHQSLVGLVVLAGLLVLVGAGCASSSVVTSKVPPASAPAPEVKTANEPDQKPVEACYANPLTSSAFPKKGILDALNTSLPLGGSGVAANTQLIAKLQDQYLVGWNVDRFCVTSMNGARVMYFTLYGYSANVIKPKLAQSVFPEQAHSTLARIGYTEGDNVEGTFVLSDIFAIGRSRAMPTKLFDTLSLDSSGEAAYPVATVEEGGKTYSISFTPDKNVTKQLNIQQMN